MEASKLNFEIKSCACAEMGGPKSACGESGGPKNACEKNFRIFKNGWYILFVLFHADSDSEIHFEIGDDLRLGCCYPDHLSQIDCKKHDFFYNFRNFDFYKKLRAL